MPDTTLLDIPREEQAQMLTALRRARYGYLLAWHVLFLCAAGRHPTDMAAFRFCSRSSSDRIVRLYRAGHVGCCVDQDGQVAAPLRTTILLPWLQRSLGALLTSAPRAAGWCRTRWSCATLAMELQVRHGREVSTWTVRRWLHEMGGVWKRAKLVAKDHASPRVERLARIRFQANQLPAGEVLVFADARDIHLVPKVGAAWMPKGHQAEVMTPGKNEKPSLAGALTLATGALLHGLGPRKTNTRFRALRTLRDRTYAAAQVTRIAVVVDHDSIHKATAVEPWLASHPRVTLLWVPTYCPRAHPIERAFGDVHDTCTRHHKRQRLRDLIRDVERHLRQNGPWVYKLSRVYDEPEVTAAGERLAAQQPGQIAA